MVWIIPSPCDFFSLSSNLLRKFTFLQSLVISITLCELHVFVYDSKRRKKMGTYTKSFTVTSSKYTSVLMGVINEQVFISPQMNCFQLLLNISGCHIFPLSFSIWFPTHMSRIYFVLQSYWWLFLFFCTDYRCHLYRDMHSKTRHTIPV